MLTEKEVVERNTGNGVFSISIDDIPPDPIDFPLESTEFKIQYILDKNNTLRLYVYPQRKKVDYKAVADKLRATIVSRIGTSAYLMESEPLLGFVYAEVGPLAVSPTVHYVEYLLRGFC